MLDRQSAGHSNGGVLTASSAASVPVRRGPGAESLTGPGVGVSVRGGESAFWGQLENWGVGWISRAAGAPPARWAGAAISLLAFRAFLPAGPEGSGAPAAPCSQAPGPGGSGSLGSLSALWRGKKVLSPTVSCSTDDWDLSPRLLLRRTKPGTDRSAHPVRMEGGAWRSLVRAMQ